MRRLGSESAHPASPCHGEAPRRPVRGSNRRATRVPAYTWGEVRAERSAAGGVELQSVASNLEGPVGGQRRGGSDRDLAREYTGVATAARSALRATAESRGRSSARLQASYDFGDSRGVWPDSAVIEVGKLGGCANSYRVTLVSWTGNSHFTRENKGWDSV